MPQGNADGSFRIALFCVFLGGGFDITSCALLRGGPTTRADEANILVRAKRLRVRVDILGHARIKYVRKYQARMVLNGRFNSTRIVHSITGTPSRAREQARGHYGCVRI